MWVIVTRGIAYAMRDTAPPTEHRSEARITLLEDGTYELQASRRGPEREGVSLEFERIVDGEVVRHMSGHAVRAAE